MPNEFFSELLDLVTPLVMKKDTNMREATPPYQRLSATLRFLVTGESYEQLKYITRISPQSLGKIIPETCSAICTVLKNYIKVSRPTKMLS